jgi:hypothetical protein
MSTPSKPPHGHQKNSPRTIKVAKKKFLTIPVPGKHQHHGYISYHQYDDRVQKISDGLKQRGLNMTMRSTSNGTDTDTHTDDGSVQQKLNVSALAVVLLTSDFVINASPDIPNNDCTKGCREYRMAIEKKLPMVSIPFEQDSGVIEFAGTVENAVECSAAFITSPNDPKYNNSFEENLNKLFKTIVRHSCGVVSGLPMQQQQQQSSSKKKKVTEQIVSAASLSSDVKNENTAVVAAATAATATAAADEKIVPYLGNPKAPMMKMKFKDKFSGKQISVKILSLMNDDSIEDALIRVQYHLQLLMEGGIAPAKKIRMVQKALYQYSKKKNSWNEETALKKSIKQPKELDWYKQNSRLAQRKDKAATERTERTERTELTAKEIEQRDAEDEMSVILDRLSYYTQFVWNKYDLDQDGVLSPIEFENFLRAITKDDNIKSEDCVRFLSNLDQNNDGTLQRTELNEFCSMGFEMNHQERKEYSKRSSMHLLLVQFVQDLKNEILCNTDFDKQYQVALLVKDGTYYTISLVHLQIYVHSKLG